MTQAEAATANHPLAPRMAAIAFLAHNLMIGCVMASYGVLMIAVEARTGANRDLSSAGIPLNLLVITLMMPLAGLLLSKVSIRALMMVGAVMTTLGFVLLAVTWNIYLFLAIYGLLMGPSMALNSTMLPTTLVTRWYDVNRGRTLGFVNMPILSLAIAPLVAFVLTRFDLTAAYLTLAGLSAVSILAAILVIDFPPNAAGPAGANVATTAVAPPAISIREVLSTGRFWGLAIAFAAITMGASTLAAHVVPLATGWGMSATRAATLISISSIGGMVGAPVWGWIADRLSGASTLAILCANNAILWSLLLLHPPYVAMAPIICLMGFSSGAIVAVISMALSQLFGRPSFSRTFGMCYFVSLPFMVGGVPAAAHVYVRTGSYVDAIVGMAAFSLLGIMGGLIGRTRKPLEIASLREPRHA